MRRRGATPRRRASLRISAPPYRVGCALPRAPGSESMADTHHGQDEPGRLEEVCTTLAAHIRDGRPDRAEDYLRLHPDLAADADSALELVYTEFLARHARGDDVPPDEWYRRFPHLGGRLDRLF